MTAATCAKHSEGSAAPCGACATARRRHAESAVRARYESALSSLPLAAGGDVVSAAVCRHWIGSDAKGRICGADIADGERLCARHTEVARARALKQADRDREKAARADAAWRARNAGKVPQWRAQLERAEAEYARRTSSVITDRAAVGGAMHPSVVRTQRSSLSDANVARVAELERIIARLKADLTRVKGAA